jgi:phosphoribosylaminoimidazole-succinocarboxamide synthase
MKMEKWLSESEMEEILLEFKLDHAEKIADGKSKALYKTCRERVCLMEFKPSLRSITYKRKQNIAGTELERMKACLSLYMYLESKGIPTQLLFDRIITVWHNGKERNFLAIKPASQIPMEWISRFYAAGSITKLFPTLVENGQKFPVPLQKYDFKQEASVAGVDDPTMNESYMVGLGLVTDEQLDVCKYYLGRISDLLNQKLALKNLRLVDLKMEFGVDSEGSVMLTDEISQDCIRVNDSKGNSLTKDAFRQWKAEVDVLKAYQQFSQLVGFDGEKSYWWWRK